MAQGLDTRHSPQLRLRCTQTDQDARIKDMSPAPARWHRHAVASESLSHSSSPHRLPCRAPPLHLARASYMIHDSCPLEGLSCLVPLLLPFYVLPPRPRHTSRTPRAEARKSPCLAEVAPCSRSFLRFLPLSIASSPCSRSPPSHQASELCHLACQDHLLAPQQAYFGAREGVGHALHVLDVPVSPALPHPHILHPAFDPAALATRLQPAQQHDNRLSETRARLTHARQTGRDKE